MASFSGSASVEPSVDMAEVCAFLKAADNRLACYAGVLIDMGFDSMESLELIEDSHLQDAGIKPGHAVLLKKRLRERHKEMQVASAVVVAQCVPPLLDTPPTTGSEAAVCPLLCKPPGQCLPAVMPAETEAIRNVDQGATVARLKLMVQSGDEQVRRSAARTLCEVAASTAQPAAVAFLETLIESHDEYVRRIATERLGPPAPHDADRPTAVVARDRVRRTAAEIVGQTPSGDEGRPVAQEPGRDTTSHIGALWIRGCREIVVLTIDRLLLDGVRAAVTDLIRAFDAGPQTSITCLAQQAQCSDEFVRRTAASTLIALAVAKQSGAMSTLPPLAVHGDEDVRRKTADALCAAANTCEEARAALPDLCESSDEHVRRAAAEAVCAATRLAARKRRAGCMDPALDKH